MAADGHLGMKALSRVTLASAGRSCSNEMLYKSTFYYLLIYLQEIILYEI